MLTEHGKCNYLAYLLADENGVSIKVAKYADETKVDLIENVTKATITDKNRIESNFVDPVALREAVINAIIHNDYTTEYPPVFEIFSNRITITSYGGLLHNQSNEDFFDGGSMPRNRELMRAFKDVGLAEQLGSGMDRIFKVYDRSIFQFFDHIIKVNFPIKSTPKSTPIKLNRTQLKIIEFLQSNSEISEKEIADELKLSIWSIKNSMKIMMENGFIKREGTSRKGK